MIITRTFPNIFRISIIFIAIFLLVAISFFMAFAIRANANFGILLPLVLNLFVLVVLYNQFSNQFTYLIKYEKGIKIIQPLKLKVIKLQWEEIKGYSISEFWYGRNLYSSKSFIIYSKKQDAIEIIKSFNLKFDEMLLSFKDNEIVKLGFEPYGTGVFQRKYKFKY